MQTRALMLLFAFLLVSADASAERYQLRHTGPDAGLNTAVSRPVQHSSGSLWARNGSGPWSPLPVAVSLLIGPPSWADWWLRCLAAGACTLLFGLELRSRMIRVLRQRRRLENTVRELTGEIQFQKAVVERQQLEIEELRRPAREVPRLVSDVPPNVSHEILAPMSGAIGLARLALHTAPQEEQRENDSTARDSTESLLAVINRLDFSKIQGGRMELSREPFFLRKCVDGALAAFQGKAQEKSLRLSCEIAPDVPRTLAGDVHRLRHVLLNLLGHAVKSTGKGKVTLAVSLGHGPGVTLHFVVRDTGIRIAPEAQPPIVQLFAPTDASSRRLGDNSLGLAISSKLVEMMQGRIWLESVPGSAGAIHFTASFGSCELPALQPPPPAYQPAEPLAADQPADQSPDQPAAPSAAPLHILVAEGNAVNRRLAQRALEELGHSLVVTGNGLRAVEAAVAQSFDLILMDLELPGMDGFEATTCIRQIELASGRHTPIVAVTAHGMDSDRENCLRSGFDGYISKPINLQALAKAIEQSRSHPVL